MSSRGPRAAGSDGTDFRHRQRIAAHYRDSVVNKARLKIALFLHTLLWLLMAFKLLEDVLDKYQIDWGPLERLAVPEPFFWEYWWSASGLAVFLGLAAMPQNNERQMSYCYYWIFSTGLVSIAVGAGLKLPELIEYVDADSEGREETETFLGFPMVVLWFMFFALAFQVHSFSMYFAYQLVKTWRVPKATESSTGTTGAVSSVSGVKTAAASIANDVKKAN